MLNFVLFGCIWIAISALMLTIESLTLLRVNLWQPELYVFVLAAAFAHYNLHYLNKPKISSERSNWSQQNKIWHAVGLCVGLFFIVASVVKLEFIQWIIIAVTGSFALIYSLPILPGRRRLKDHGVLKILTLSFVWTAITVVLPGFGSADRPLFWIMIVRRFLFMLVLCLAFDIRDIELDQKQNIQTIPLIIGVDSTYYLVDILLIFFVSVTLMISILNQRYFTAFAMVVSAILTRFVIRLGKRYSSEKYYLGVVDGMMPLQAILVIAAITLERKFFP